MRFCGPRSPCRTRNPCPRATRSRHDQVDVDVHGGDHDDGGVHVHGGVHEHDRGHDHGGVHDHVDEPVAVTVTVNENVDVHENVDAHEPGAVAVLVTRQRSTWTWSPPWP
jgi:hypothetical protein